MTSDGKKLEAWVAYVEQALLPPGFSVECNKCIYNDDGAQIAELDVSIKGKVGTSAISWLIECRDRQGAAPISWIEQLSARRTRLKFNKVTAVSTSGFSPAAAQFAAEAGIELREVTAIEPSELNSWMSISQVTQRRNTTHLKGAKLILDAAASQVVKVAAEKTVSNNDDIRLLSPIGSSISLHHAFFGAVAEVGNAFDGIKAGVSRRIELTARYVDPNRLMLETEEGPCVVTNIIFSGELSVDVTVCPLVEISQYRHHGGGEIISQIAAFKPISALGAHLGVEFHHISETGGTHVTMRVMK